MHACLGHLSLISPAITWEHQMREGNLMDVYWEVTWYLFKSRREKKAVELGTLIHIIVHYSSQSSGQSSALHRE